MTAKAFLSWLIALLLTTTGVLIIQRYMFGTSDWGRIGGSDDPQ